VQWHDAPWGMDLYFSTAQKSKTDSQLKDLSFLFKIAFSSGAHCSNF
jgi:hypothetical protein